MLLGRCQKTLNPPRPKVGLRLCRELSKLWPVRIRSALPRRGSLSLLLHALHVLWLKGACRGPLKSRTRAEVIDELAAKTDASLPV